MKALVLFDIDGTLLSSNGAAPRAFRQALEEIYGTSGPLEGYSFAGRTDPQIARDLLRMAGLEDATIERNFDETWSRYVELLEAEFRSTRATVYPGVHKLLDRLEADGDSVVLGLLTGNVVEGARLKLHSAGIDFGRFVVGAFGSDHAERSELPAIAVERAHRVLGHGFRGESVVIVGDTPKDIACGEHLGVRTIAVATGSYSADELRECGPDFLFDDLTDTDAVREAIYRPPTR